MLNAPSKSSLVALTLATFALSGCGSADQPPADTATETASAPVAAEMTVPAQAAAADDTPIDLASADVAAGKAYFEETCAVCHSLAAGEGSAIGPHLDGVVGRKIASVEGFGYSSALSSHGGNWDAATLAAYLESPQSFAPGTMMGFAGTPDAATRANVIAYLATVK